MSTVIVLKNNIPVCFGIDWLIDYYRIAKTVYDYVDVDGWMWYALINWKTINEFLKENNIKVFYYSQIQNWFIEREF